MTATAGLDRTPHAVLPTATHHTIATQQHPHHPLPPPQSRALLAARLAEREAQAARMESLLAEVAAEREGARRDVAMGVGRARELERQLGEMQRELEEQVIRGKGEVIV